MEAACSMRQKEMAFNLPKTPLRDRLARLNIIDEVLYGECYKRGG